MKRKEAKELSKGMGPLEAFMFVNGLWVVLSIVPIVLILGLTGVI